MQHCCHALPCYQSEQARTPAPRLASNKNVFYAQSYYKENNQVIRHLQPPRLQLDACATAPRKPQSYFSLVFKAVSSASVYLQKKDQVDHNHVHLWRTN